MADPDDSDSPVSGNDPPSETIAPTTGATEPHADAALQPAEGTRRTPQRQSLADRIGTFIGAAIALTMMGLGLYGAIRTTGTTALEVFANARWAESITTKATATGSGPGWIIDGRVLDAGQTVEGASVWTIVTDARGHQYAPDPVDTDKDGKFTIHFLTGSGRDTATSLVNPEATVYAKKVGSWRAAKEGRRAISLTGVARLQVITYSTSAIWLILTWFGSSFLLAFWTPSLPQRWIKPSYYTAVALTFTLSMAIIVAFYLAVGELTKDSTAAKGEVVTLGFVNIFKGTYLAEGRDELLVSMSSAPTAIKVVSADHQEEVPPAEPSGTASYAHYHTG